jgi:stage IV sporulation protein B
VLVSGTEEFKNESGQYVCPAKDKVKKGDYIVEVDGRKINSKSQLSNIIKNNGSNSLILKINRNGEESDITLKAEKDKDGNYMLGIWVKDDDQGIGTLTYIDSKGEFGLLGHGITDSDTNELMSSDNGLLYKTNIWGIKKGISGDPGALMGSIDYREENIIGNIDTNTNVGVFGIAGEELLNECSMEPMDIGFKQEVKKGKAYIRCCVDGEIKDYEIRILKIDSSGNNEDKSMLIQVTDDELIDKTGGIVQGMSGSPIIQNDKIIGAVTHVLVDEPTKGYGIFIENMLDN